MATSDVLSIIRGPARLVLTPTDLTAAFPYGGTPLGLARACEFRFGVTSKGLPAEEWGATAAVAYLGSFGALAAVLRAWDADAIANAFPTFVAGASGQPTVSVDVNGTVRAGAYIPGFKILMVPLESPTVNPAVILYGATPRPDGAARIEFSRKNEAGIAVMWEALPDSNGRTYFAGLLEDMSL